MVALIVIDAQQEYFAPAGKIVLPGGPPAGGRVAAAAAARGVERVLLAGFMTQMCVDTTARQAAHRGFQVTVLSDATAAMAVQAPDGETIPAAQVHRTHLGSLSGFIAEVKPLAAVIDTKEPAGRPARGGG